MINPIFLFLSYLLLIGLSLIGINVADKKLTHKRLRNKKTLALFLFLIAYVMLVVSLYYILSFGRIFSITPWFWTFAISAFIMLPISIALIVVAYTIYFRNISSKTFVNLFISMLFFSFAASTFHDFLWCAHATDFYTQPKAGGYDLEIWVNLFGMPNDYRFFGAFMTLLMVTFLFFGFKVINKYIKNVRKNFILAGIFLLGAFLYFIDMVPWYGRLAAVGVISTLLPISIYIFIKTFEDIK